MRSALLITTILAGWATAAPLAMARADTADSAGATELTTIVVVAPERLDEVAGAATVVTADEFERSQPFSINDILRRVPGLFPRGEEGLALRPNIGFRGLTPTRSTEVLLLEDGVPLAYAPYGDNASYYHPPFERFSSVEVLKGSAQIAFGPHTVGGVVNYVTPEPPDSFEGRLILRGGGRDTREIVLQAGDTVGEVGLFASYAARESDGVRDENQRLAYQDLFFKAVRPLGDNQELTFKASAFAEDSQISYSGLTLAEFRANPRGNPFHYDRFETEHYALSLVHGWRITDDLTLTTALYGATFGRDWWRQSSNSGQRPNDASDPLCGGMANVSTTCGNEGRLRQYYSLGLDSRFAWDWTAGAVSGRLTGGVRVHHENQERLQFNGDLPWSRTPGVTANAGVRENGVRQASAASAFVQNAATFGQVTVTAGLRVESIDYERVNKLTGQRGDTDVDAVIGGLGVAWAPNDRLTLFAGAWDGFSPPRVEDVISAAGGIIDLDAEESLNLELGLRGRPGPGLRVEATLFQMDFDNQIVPGTLAGGVLTNAGPTMHQGIEGAFSWSSKEASGTAIDWRLDGTVTNVATAEYRADRGVLSINGNRLPYAPEWFGRLAAGFETPGGVQAELEAVYTGEMFADELNTVAVTANGQKGIIPSVTVYNLSAAWQVTPTVRLSAQVRNLEDKLYVADRTRGILPGEPRTALVGIELRY
ncbi:MAG: TonB-dependent receptor family protein [Pseudomonadota bacterium]